MSIFDKLVSPWNITNDNGELVNARNLPPKSINTPAVFAEFFLTPHFTHTHMKALSDKILLQGIMEYISRLSNDCATQSVINDNWDCVYDTGIVYYLDNLIKRYKQPFQQHNIDTSYKNQDIIVSLYENSLKDWNITVDNVCLENPCDIINCNIQSQVLRGDTAGFHTLIPHYTDAQFNYRLREFMKNCSRLNSISLIHELLDRIERGDYYVTA